MKIQMDASDLRDAVRDWLDGRGVDAQHLDLNLFAKDGAFVRADVIVRAPPAEGVKPRTRRIPIIGAA